MKQVFITGYPFKQVFEGYLCHSEKREKLYGYTMLLSKSPPMKRKVELHWGETEEIIIPQVDEDVVFSEGNLFDECDKGKKYRIVIEEIPSIRMTRGH